MITSDNLRSVKFLDGKNQLNWKSRSTSSSLNKILRRPGLAHVTHGHTILRAQIHARHIEDVHRLIWMFLVMPLEGLPKLRQRLQVPVSLQLLLAFATGEYQPSMPRRWVALMTVSHSPGLDADFL